MSNLTDDCGDDDWEKLTGQPPTNRGRRRRLPSSAQTLVDGSPLRRTETGEVDVDGDPFSLGESAEAWGEDRVRGLVQGGHGFTTETVQAPKQVLVNCRYCGGMLYRPDGSTVEWLCEFGLEELRPDCECNWCLCRNLWLAGEYRGRGRPRFQCGSVDCMRAMAAERSKRYRARKRAGGSASRLFHKGEGPVCSTSSSSDETCVQLPVATG